MELNEGHKNDPSSLVFILSAAYRIARYAGENEQEVNWASKAAAVNRFCRIQVKADPRWRYIGMAVFNIWKSYFQILAMNRTKSMFRNSRIKSEERVLTDRIAELNRQAAIWEGIKNGK